MRKIISLLFVFLLIPLMGFSTYYSQCQQDKIIHENYFLGYQSGVFVDVGAHDGITFSNSYFFENELKWTGICIEPIPEIFKELVINRKCQCIQGCVTDYSGDGKFFKVSSPTTHPAANLEMLSGLVMKYNPIHLNRMNSELSVNGGALKTIDVKCYLLNDILKQSGITHVNLLSIDTEGGEFEILSSIDFDQYKIDVITVEDNYNDPRFIPFLKKKGFNFAQRIEQDLIFVHEHFKPFTKSTKTSTQLPSENGTHVISCADSRTNQVSESVGWDQHKQTILNELPKLLGWNDRQKAERIMEFIRETQPKTCVEIGAFGGAMTYPIAGTLKFLKQGIVYAIDAWDTSAAIEGLEDEQTIQWWKSLDMKVTHQEFIKLLNSKQLNQCHPVQKRSQDAVSLFADESIDFLFMDGNGSRKGSLEDARLYLPKVKQGGFLWLNHASSVDKNQALNFLTTHCKLIKEKSIGTDCVLFQKINNAQNVSTSSVTDPNIHKREYSTNAAPLDEHKSHTYNLSMCAIFKNEGAHLKEWIEYHKLVGVEHFYLYNNMSNDNYLEILSPYIRSNEVTLIDWPDRAAKEPRKHKDYVWVSTTQVPAYQHAFQLDKNSSKWMTAIDLDEFIVPVKEEKITQVLEKYEKDFPGVEIFWRIYGTGGVYEIPKDRLMVETLNKMSCTPISSNTPFKTILRPNFFEDYTWAPHRCAYKDGRKAATITPQELVINHYYNGTINDFYANKLKNKENNVNTKYTSEEIANLLSIGNDVEDQEKIIHRFVPALRAKMQLPPKEIHIDLVSTFDVKDFAISEKAFKQEPPVKLSLLPPLTASNKIAPDTQKVIIFNQLVDPTILSAIPKEKLIYFQWEPWEVPFTYYQYFSRVYTWDDDLVDNIKFFKIYYPHLMPMEKNLPPFDQKKLCVMVAGSDINPVGRNNDLYSERIQMVNFFETKPKGEFEIYGQNWNKRHYRDYISAIPGFHSGPEKISALKQYKFSICFENTKNINGYVTEKIFCCFAAGCVPVYWGAQNIEKYVPKNCFIDYRDFKSQEELYQFLKSMPKKTYDKYLENIRAFLNSEKAQLFTSENLMKILYGAMTEQ